MNKCNACNINPLLCPYDVDCPDLSEGLQLFKLKDEYDKALVLLQELVVDIQLHTEEFDGRPRCRCVVCHHWAPNEDWENPDAIVHEDNCKLRKAKALLKPEAGDEKM